MNKEKSLKEAYSKLLEVGFGEGSLEDIPQFIDENVMGYGTALDEKIMSIQEFRDLMIDQRKQSLNFDEFSVTSKPVINRISDNGNTAVIVDEVVLLTLIQGESNELSVRMSTVFEFKEGTWKLIHWHGSKPEHFSGGDDPWHVNEWKRKNEQLQKLVDEKTFELLNKNRELEIETALEKVRTIAMSMRKPDDMLEVCKTISVQLESLGVKEIRNVQTAIFYETKKTYINFEHYTKHNKSLITEVDYRTHELQELFANKMIKGVEELFSETLRSKEVKDWYAYQKTTNQFADSFLETAESLSYYWYSLGPVALGMSTYVPLNEQEINLFNRFRNVFELAYRRYLDIEQAEEQAREAQIEASLERVRAVAMSMQKPDDLLGICEVSFKEFKKLGFDNLRNSLIHILDYDEKDFFLDYDFSDSTGGNITKIFYKSHPIIENYLAQIKSAEDAFAEVVINGSQLSDWKDFRLKTGQADDPRLNNLQALYYYGYSIGVGDISISTFKPIDESQIKILKRFRNVFDLAYRRYIDIALAEAQAREAQIELGLERVRARAMAMQKSDELSELVDTVFKELTKLDFALTWCIINIIAESSMSNTVWAANPDINKAPESYHMLFEDYPFHHAMMKGWKERKTKDVYVLEGQEKKVYDEYLFNETEFRRVPAVAQASSRAMEKYVVTFSFSNFGGLQTVGEVPLSDTNIDILSRFGKVFDLTYTRFNDLKKAEAQAREAKIEAALERVRSRTMAMQKSEELKDVIRVVYDQFIHLKINVDHAGFVVDYTPKGDWHFWIADEQDIPSKITHPYFESVWANQFDEAKEKGIDFFVTNLNFEEKNKFYNELLSYVPGLPQASKDFYLSCPGLAATTVLFDNVSLYIENFSGTPYSDEENKILMRFGKVFQQTYTRFLDLQKAEAQAREAQIEAALEKVRSSSMAMHKSPELADVIAVVSEQLQQLKIKFDHVSFAINSETEDYNFWTALYGKPRPYELKVPYLDNPIANRAIEVRAKGLNFYQDTLTPEENREWLEHAFKYNPTDYLSVKEKAYALRHGFSRSFVIMPNIILNVGNYASKPYSDEDNEIIKRFAKVFEQTYTRFLDLKNAEAQAREAKIEAALERVRAKTMSMHRSDELADSAAVVFQQLINLGIEPNRIYIAIMKDEKGNVEFWITDEDGSKVSTGFEASLNENISFKKMFEGWKNKEKSKIIDMQGDELQKYFIHLTNLGVPFKDGLSQKRRLQYIAYFSKGFIGVASPDKTKPETIQLLERFAAVFNLTYTRFNDLLQAEAQNKIIQAENERKSKELEDARQLQLSMLPKELPRVPNLDIAVYMKTATEVGGDYYDFNVDVNGTLTLIVGDATGHGMMSGMMVSIMKSFFISNKSNIELKQFFENANNSIKDMHLGRLMMALAGIQITSEKIIATNAGMPSLIYFRNKSQKAGEFVSNNLPLGGMKGTKYLLKEINYEKGDTLLLMSDGFAELKNENSEQYGYDRIIKEFKSVAKKNSEEIVEHLKNSAFKWNDKAEPEDDITFIVIKVRG